MPYCWIAPAGAAPADRVRHRAVLVDEMLLGHHRGLGRDRDAAVVVEHVQRVRRHRVPLAEKQVLLHPGPPPPRALRRCWSPGDSRSCSRHRTCTPAGRSSCRRACTGWGPARCTAPRSDTRPGRSSPCSRADDVPEPIYRRPSPSQDPTGMAAPGGPPSSATACRRRWSTCTDRRPAWWPCRSGMVAGANPNAVVWQ